MSDVDERLLATLRQPLASRFDAQGDSDQMIPSLTKVAAGKRGGNWVSLYSLAQIKAAIKSAGLQVVDADAVVVPRDCSAPLNIVVLKGVEGPSVYINDYRVAGNKPWGGGQFWHGWHDAKVSDIYEPLLHALRAQLL